jgi:hypothetical protein
VRLIRDVHARLAITLIVIIVSIVIIIVQPVQITIHAVLVLMAAICINRHVPTAVGDA